MLLAAATLLGLSYQSPSQVTQQVKDARLMILADFLYWTAQEDGLDFSYKATGTPGQLPATDIKIEQLSTPWNAGFRIGLGYRLPHDCWQAKGYVTQFRTTNHFDASAKQGEFFLPNVGALPNSGGFSLSSGNWHLKYTLFDLELARTFYPSKASSLTPFLGARFARIEQHVHTRFLEPLNGNVSTSLDLKGQNNYTAFGLRLGSGLQFFLARYVSFFGECAFSLLSGHFNMETRLNSKTDTLFSNEAKLQRLRACGELRGGAKGTIPLYRKQAFLTLGLTYDMAFWFAQNQLLHFLSTSNALQVASGSGDLTLQGITFCTRLDF